MGGERLLHLQRGANRAFGIVLVCNRRAEQSHDRVAEDFVDLAAERGHVGDEALEAPVDKVLEVLGVHRLAE